MNLNRPPKPAKTGGLSFTHKTRIGCDDENLHASHQQF